MLDSSLAQTFPPHH